MIIQDYSVSCDICHTSRLQIKAKMIHNAETEIEEAGWITIAISADQEITKKHPYLARHACPDCQAQKDHERRGG